MSDQEEFASPAEGEEVQETYEETTESSVETEADGDEDTGSLKDLLATKGIPDVGNHPTERPPVRAPKTPTPAPQAAPDPMADTYERMLKARSDYLQQQPPPQTEEERKRHNEMWANIRLKDKENKILKARLESLEKAIQRTPEEKRTDEAELPDKDTNPGAYLISKIEQLENRFKQKDEQEYVQKTIQGHLNEVAQARDLALQFRQSNPEAYDSAITHLAQVTKEELEDNVEILVNQGLVNPTGDIEQQLLQIMARSMADRMVQWRKQGMNPGEEFVKMAARRGWQWTPPAAPAPAEPASLLPPAVATQLPAHKIIEQQREKQKKAATLSGLGVAPGARGNLKKVLASNDVDEYIDGTKGMTFKQIMQDKLIRGG